MRKSGRIFASSFMVLYCFSIASSALAVEVLEGEAVDFVNFAAEEPTVEVPVAAREVDGTQRITIILDDVSLEDTVRLFARTTGANIIAAVDLLRDRRVNVILQDVPWLSALRSILDTHDFELAERTPGSGIYTIQTKRPDAPTPTEVRTYFLDFASAIEVERPLRDVLRANGTLSLFPSRNALVVRSTEANLVEIENLLKSLDRPSRQVLIEAKILELSDSAVKQLGIRWDSLEAFGLSATIDPLSYRQETTRGSFSAGGQLGFDRSVQNETRVRSPGAVAETFFLDPSIQEGPFTSANSLGARFSPEFNTATILNPLAPQGFQSVDQRLAGQANEFGNVDARSRVTTESRGAILGVSDLQVVLSALEKLDGVSIVSNPKLIVPSGSTNSFISLGRREPIILESVTFQRVGQDVIPIREITLFNVNTEYIKDGFLELGVLLEVTATLKSDNYIEATIRPSIRRKIGEKTIMEGGQGFPILDIKEINTTFTVRSGQTVAIGGLTSTEEGKRTTRVPFLGSIPIIGRLLFTHTRDVKEQVETIILVTMSVAEPDALERSAGIPEDSRLVHNRLLRDDIQRQEMDAAAENPEPAKRRLFNRRSPRR
jgi:type IV pilus assembly protein PilQ